MKHLFQGFCCLLLLVTATAFTKEEHTTEEKTNAVQKERHEAFAKKMKGVDLVGTFTVDGKKDVAKEERYEIKSAKKGKGDYWMITARIQYGKTDVEVPVTVKVLWAGDTPVITMTDMKIPLMGTFTCRVMIYGDRYAGTWQHGKTGGLMYGHLKKTTSKKIQSKKESSKI